VPLSYIAQRCHKPRTIAGRVTPARGEK